MNGALAPHGGDRLVTGAARPVFAAICWRAPGAVVSDKGQIIQQRGECAANSGISKADSGAGSDAWPI